MKVYDLIYYIDMHVTEQEFSGYFDSLETLVKYFVKGTFFQIEEIPLLRSNHE